MGELFTAGVKLARSGVGRTDRNILIDEPEFFALDHPPYMTITDAESLEALAPPDDLIKDWNKFMLNGHSGVEGIVLGWGDLDYEERYIEHIESNFAAEKQLDKIIKTLENNNVCLVCGCGYLMYRFCPRRILHGYITDGGGRGDV